jgi:hypothetical protein
MIKHVGPDPPRSPEQCRRVGEPLLRWFVCGVVVVDVCCAGGCGSTDEKAGRGVCWVYICVRVSTPLPLPTV